MRADNDNKKKKLALIAVGVLLVLAIGAYLLFGGGGKKPTPTPDPTPTPGPDPTPQPVKVLAVATDLSEYTVGVGKTVTVYAVVAPEDAENKTLTFTVKDTSVASVDGNGVVTGLKAGETELEVSSADGPKAAAKIHVVETVWIAMPQSSYSWNMKAAGSGHSDGWKCVPILDESLKDAKITFKTDDTGIAKVSKDGTVTCYCKPGATVLTATAEKDGKTYSAKMDIYVNGGLLSLSPVRSHEGAGRADDYVYFAGCTCEDNGKAGISYCGTYTKWLNGKKTTMDITDKRCPKLALASGGEYFETASDNGHLIMKDKCASISKYTTVDIVLCGSDNGADILLDESGCGFTVRLEPIVTVKNEKGSFITDLMYINPAEYNCFVLGNGYPCKILFNTIIDEFKYDAGYFSNVGGENKTSYQFTVNGADGGATKINTTVYSIGGQPVTFHIISDKPENYISWASPNTALKSGDSVSIKPTIDPALAECTGGVKVSYKVVKGSSMDVDASGKATALKGGSAVVSAEVSFTGAPGAKVEKSYTFDVADIFSLRMTLNDAAYLYYAGGRGNSVPYKVELCRLVNGQKEVVKDVTKDPGVSISRYLGSIIDAKDGQIYMKTAVEEMCDDLLNAVYTYNGEKLSSNQVKVYCEPPVRRPSVYSNVGFGDVGFGDCFLIMNPAEEFQLRFTHHRCAQFAVMSGAQYVENIYMDANGEFITLKMNIADNSQEVVVRFWTYGGQYYDGTFTVH